MRDHHHTWHERGWYTSRTDKVFRSYAGFVVLTDRRIHNHLHAVVQPPIKPNPQLMRQTLDMLREYDPVPQDNIPRTAEFMYTLADRSDDELTAVRLQRIGANLLAQNTILFSDLYDQQHDLDA